MKNPGEVLSWRQVIGSEGVYEVSDTGLVKRVAGGRGASGWKVLDHCPLTSSPIG